MIRLLLKWLVALVLLRAAEPMRVSYDELARCAKDHVFLVDPACPKEWIEPLQDDPPWLYMYW